MKKVVWAITLLGLALLGNVTAAQADGHFDTKVKTIHEIENILKLIADVDATKHSDKAQLNAEKQQLKQIAITKLKSI